MSSTKYFTNNIIIYVQHVYAIYLNTLRKINNMEKMLSKITFLEISHRFNILNVPTSRFFKEFYIMYTFITGCLKFQCQALHFKILYFPH